jgi:hypothetical protein
MSRVTEQVIVIKFKFYALADGLKTGKILARRRCRWQNNVKMGFQEMIGRMWTGFDFGRDQ